MTLRGSVEAIGLVDLLQLIQGSAHSGTLKVVAGDLTSKLYFYKGQLYLPTGGAGGALKVGALLVRARKISGRDLLRALALQAGGSGGDRLGEVLVREGLVRKDDLDQVVRRLYEEEIYDLLFRDGAYFEWRRDVLPAGFADARGGIRGISFDTRSILLEASRRQDEWRRIRATIPTTKAVYRTTQPGEPRAVESEDVIELSRPELEGLPSDQAVATKVLEALQKAGAVLDSCPFDGARSLDDVVAATSLTPFEALGAIARLREEGVLRPIAAPEIEPRALRCVAEGRTPDAYKLYSWANEAERLRRIASSLDKQLLLEGPLKQAGRPAVAGRTGGARALTILSRLLRRGAPFQLHAREEESAIDVYVTARTLRLHLMGPRRTHSALRYLRARGAISEDDLKKARETATRTGRDIDRVLLDDRFVSREAWLLAVKDKVVSALFSIFEWQEPFIEVSADPQVPPGSDEVRGLVVEIPLDPELREDLRKDLLRWKSILEAVPSPDVVFICERPTPEGKRKKTKDLFDGRRSVADLLALAKVAPLELVSFLLKALLEQKIRRLTDREHRDRLDAAEREGRLDDAIAYAKSAVAFGFSSEDFRRRLLALREQRKGMPSAEGRPTVHGELGQVSLAEVLQLLHGGKRTGTLRISGPSQPTSLPLGPEKERTLYLDGGEVFILTVADQEPDEDLQQLLGESAIERLNIKEAFAKRGRLREDEIGKAEIDRIKQELFEAFLWEGAQFEFLQNFLPPELRANSPNTTRIALKTDLLLFEAMQRLSEWDDMRKVLRSAHAVFRFATSEAKAEAISGEQGPLAYLFDGDLSLAEVVRRSGEDRYRVYRFASGLVSKHALVFSHQKQGTGIPGALGETPTRKIVAAGASGASGRVQAIAPAAPELARPELPTPAQAFRRSTIGRGFPGLAGVAPDKVEDSTGEIAPTPGWGIAPEATEEDSNRAVEDSVEALPPKPPAPPLRAKKKTSPLRTTEILEPLPEPLPADTVESNAGRPRDKTKSPAAGKTTGSTGKHAAPGRPHPDESSRGAAKQSPGKPATDGDEPPKRQVIRKWGSPPSR